MSHNRRLVNKIHKFYKQRSKKFLFAIKKQIIWLLRTLFVPKRQRATVNAGFVLPTVVMVTLVVVLLTFAILFRSFERSKNASNVRIDQATLNAAMPAVDRAKAKIAQLLSDPSLPASTPTDVALYDVISNNPRYNFGDETNLMVAFDINGDGQISNTIGNPNNILEIYETSNTAWKFPVDTDNNGKFDTYTLYAIYFRSPTRDNTTNTFNRVRNPLEARTPPMNQSQLSGACAAALGTSASLVGDSDWYTTAGTLSKSFFVYTANVPIQNITNLDTTKFETSKGNTGFSAIEYQQDRQLIPINNQAVWFENDLEITPGALLTLNGGVHTNANLLASAQYNANYIVFHQVSSQYSCFYNQQNAKITVGGNFGTGNVSTTTFNPNTVQTDLFNGYQVAPTQNGNAIIGGSTPEQSTALMSGSLIGFNDAAYSQRISKMTNDALNICTACTTVLNNPRGTVAQLQAAVSAVSSYPQQIITNFQATVSQTSGIDLTGAYTILSNQIDLFLRNHTRRVPFAEVPQPIPTSTQALTPYTATSNVLTNGTSGQIEVPPEWRLLTYTQVPLVLNKLSATDPVTHAQSGVEAFPGDRVLVGNNLPAYWKTNETATGQYVSGNTPQNVDNGTTMWNNLNTIQRTRTSQIQPQLSLGTTDRNDFWEQNAAANNASTPLANFGGLRVVTGAGIYVDDDGINRSGETPNYPRSIFSFLPVPTTVFPSSTTTPGIAGLDPVFVGSAAGQMPTPQQFQNSGTSVSNIVAWSDAMPMTGGPSAGATQTGDLLMRATAVYHYAGGTGTSPNYVDRTPIACVSSYYDPTNATTARNANILPWNNTLSGGKSNNGIVYSPPARNIDSVTLGILERQSRLVFPNGRIVNEPLRDAMQKYTLNSGNFNNFTFEDYSSIDTALCSIAILGTVSGTPITPVSNPLASIGIAHGKIKEAAFLNPREIKAIQNRADYQNSVDNYGLDLEQRQPLEIRVTDIDVGSLAAQAAPFATGEYLLPNSGIIYATRDDALQDLSYATVATPQPNLSNQNQLAQVKLFSQTDYKLDPTRRPNGIRLINGGILARSGANSLTYNQSEKGLILVSNLPVYVKDNFNLHRVNPTDTTQIEEFTQLVGSTGFYGRSTPNSNYACRPGRTGCPTTGGDLWRPSTIIADAVTLLSGSFQDGFRYQGDYDLRNNAVTIPEATILVNNFVTSANWAAATGYPSTNFLTSYLANAITPIQRRSSTAQEYLMEVCTKVPASQCGSADWYIRPPLATAIPPVTALKSSDIAATLNTSIEVLNLSTRHQAGTTAQPAASQYQSYARRVAFLRDSNNNLLDANGNLVTTTTGSLPVPLGVGTNGYVQKFPYSSFNTSQPRTAPSGSLALWFRTSSSTTDPTNINNAIYNAVSPLFIQALVSGTQQPQLVPVPQIFSTQGSPSANLLTTDQSIQTQWLQSASTTIFNSAFVGGNTPSRPTEESAGLHNFVRLVENWIGDTAQISGSFLQPVRSSYSTAPFAHVLAATASATATTTNNLSFFDFVFNKYMTGSGNPPGTLPYYNAPTRTWGFDVALLSQLPDLFAQRFTTPASGSPSEYFRQVGKEDSWVNSLLCAKQKSGSASTTWDTLAAPGNSSSCPTPAYPL